MALSDALSALDDFLDDLALAQQRETNMPIALIIICPDCGKNPPFRNRCPKCGGDSWIPAGPVDGIFEWIKARR